MKSFAVISAFVATTLAVPSPDIRKDIKQARVTVQHQKQTALTEITIKDQTTSALFGHACSKSLSSGQFTDFSVAADLDSNGAGNLTVGPNTYRVHENPEHSGGIKCMRVYDQDESYVICDNIPLPASLQLNPIAKRDNAGCFTQTINARGLQKVAEALHFNEDSFPTEDHFSLDGQFETASLATLEPEKSLEERQFGPCNQWVKKTQLVGNGNPHQNYWHKQLSVSHGRHSFTRDSIPITDACSRRI